MRLHHALVAPLLVVVVVGAGGTAVEQPKPFPIAGPLSPGTYAIQVFKPNFTFTAGSGWLVGGHGDATGVIALQDARFASTNYLVVLNVRDSCTEEGFRSPVPSPRQVMASLGTRPWVAAAKPRPARIGGVSGLAIDFTVVSTPPAAPKRRPCLTYLSTVTPESPFRYAIWYKQSKHRLIALVVKRQVVVVEIIAPKGDFGRFAEKADAFVRTVRWR